jgi:hypothetical protein
VAVATSARLALRSAPEPRVPAGLAAAALEEAAREAAEEAPNVRAIGDVGTPRWYRLLAGAGVAAAIVLAGALILPRIGEGGDGFGRVGSAVDGSQEDAVAPAPQGPASKVEAIAGDLSDEEVRSAALELFDGAAAVPNASAVPAQGENAFSLAVSRAEGCLARAFPHLAGRRAARLWRADYLGEETYVGFYLESPGADLPAGYVRVWIASVKGCQVVASTQIVP